MKTLKAIIILICFFATTAAETAVPDKQETEWPKKIVKEEAHISIYQPQVNSLEGDILDARAALSVKKKGEKLVFGAIWFTSKLDTDFDTRLVSLTDFNVESVKFPDLDETGEAAMIELLESEVPGMDLTYSLDRLLTSLELAEQGNEMSEKLNHAAPKIYFEDEAAVLVLIDGEPILKDIEDTKIQYVVNTPYFILYNKADGFFYLKGGDWWYRAGRVENTWRHINTPPASITQITPTDDSYETDVDSIAKTLKYPPKVILSKVPAELIITDGEPDFAALAGTDLLYVRNTESEILMDINSQDYYVLLAGRWYISKSLDPTGWEFVNPDELPEYFAAISSESEIGSVRSSIPETREAREAILENEIPQTAEVNRRNASINVEYDGNPEFERIKGTDMLYAVNTDKSVLMVDNRYYAVDNAVWFVSDHAAGPWEVCVSVPNDVQSIPPEYPVYNVKYVYVYDYTPDVVYVGYTPGYVYSYRYRGTVVYGTGYYYRPWYRTWYYPRPVTYGYGVHYNPYSGWGFSVGISYGWIGYTYHRRPYYYTSWWGPAGYCYGHRHGYYHGYSRAYYRGYYRGYSYGVYASSRSGYRAGYYDGYQNHRHSHNIYKSRSTGVIHTGARATTVNRVYTPRANRKNNVYTDRNGNIYRQRGDTWQSREGGSWKKSARTTGAARSTDPGSGSVTLTRTEPGTATRKSSTTTSREAATRTRTTSRTRTDAGTRTMTRTGTTNKTGTTNRTGTATRAGSTVKSSGTDRSTGSRSSYGTVRSRPATGTGQELKRESNARSQGSQRSYNYQQSRQQPKKSSSASRTRTSSSRSPASTGASRSSSSRSSATRSRSSASQTSKAKQRKR